MIRLVPAGILVFLVSTLSPTLQAQASLQAQAPSDQPSAVPESAADGLNRARDGVVDRAERVERRIERVGERIQRRLADRWNREDGAHVLFGRDYTLPEGATASEAVVVFGGTATIDGHVQDDVVVMGGTLRLGPTAVVDGDVAVVAGTLERDPAARVAGDVDVARFSGLWGWVRTWPQPGRIWWNGAALGFTIGRFVLMLLIAVLLLAITPRSIANIAAQLSRAPGVSTIAGFGAEILFAPALGLLIITLIITIVGIPLLAGVPLLVAAFGLVWVAGYAAVAALLGARLRGIDWQVHGLRPADVVIGSVVLSAITIFGQALTISPGWAQPFALFVRGTGWMIEYGAWTVGLGAALTAWLRQDRFDGWARPVVPPLPTPSPNAN